jgi:CPA1 family monovalent cation:H+ antiporter
MTQAASLINNEIFIGFFLLLVALLHGLSKKTKFPFTVILLLVGFAAQFLDRTDFVAIDLSLSTDIIYYIMLPLLLFESAMHINFHQFKLQFKTITALTTTGLLMAVGVIAAGLHYLLQIPWMESLLFGSLISATDPIAVLALFKSLGAPRRLGLLAEGESMFNDATGVIAFRFFAGILFTSQAVEGMTVAFAIFDFLYVFVGSLLVGGIMGWVISEFIARVENDKLIETTLTLALALISFVAAEHYFHLSGVISAVAAAITLGNVGRTRISGDVLHFMEELWEYVGFVCIAFIFFFAAFSLDWAPIFANPIPVMISIILVMVGRAISVYGSFFISNRLPLFKDEPNVPLSWQHIMNWGGLRGVIPLVLVATLPEDFVYRELFLAFTLANFVFTLLINATTIGVLLTRLGLHLPRKEESIIRTEMDIFEIEKAKEALRQVSDEEFDRDIVLSVHRRLMAQELQHKKFLSSLATPKELEHSLKMQAIEIERNTLQRLFEHGHINENVYFQFEGELDLQQDALEYPEVSSGRGYGPGGHLDTSTSFRQRLLRLRMLMKSLPFLKGFLWPSKEQLIVDRLQMLQARILASSEAIEYFQKVKQLMLGSLRATKAVDDVISEHEQLRLKNNFQLQALAQEYPKTYAKFQQDMISTYVWTV